METKFTLAQEKQRMMALEKTKELCKIMCEDLFGEDTDERLIDFFCMDLTQDIAWVMANQFPDRNIYLPHGTETGEIKDYYKKGELNYD